MSTMLLRDFVTRVLSQKRVRFGDVRRLSRDVLPDGITTRDEAEVLIALDQTISKTDMTVPGATISSVPSWNS